MLGLNTFISTDRDATSLIVLLVDLMEDIFYLATTHPRTVRNDRCEAPAVGYPADGIR